MYFLEIGNNGNRRKIESQEFCLLLQDCSSIHNGNLNNLIDRKTMHPVLDLTLVIVLLLLLLFILTGIG